MKKILKEEAIIRLKNYNPNIKLIGEYESFTKKTYFKCDICGYVKFSSFYDMINSSRKLGCLKCEKRKKNKKERSRSKHHEQYILDVYNAWGNLIKVIGQYDSANKKIEVGCNVCNHIWNPEARTLLSNHGCPKCGHNKNRNATVKKHIEYVNEVTVKHNNNISVIGTYISNSKRILIKCNICQYEWLVVARNIIKGGGLSQM